jgi:RimJ/RimL family protein N-acetyltransferase
MAVMPTSDFDPFNYSIAHNSLNLVLSVPQQSDGDVVLKALNDPLVYSNLEAPPFPYTPKDWDTWYHIVKDATERCRQEWVEVMQGHIHGSGRSDGETVEATKTDGKWVGGGQWVSTIRVKVPQSEPFAQTSTQPFIGEITIRRSGFPHIQDHAFRCKAVEANSALPAGDPNIVWEVGFYLIPEYHGKGIMPIVLTTLTDQVLVPYMNIHRLIGTYFEHNTPSRRVFEKCGFQFLTSMPKAIILPELKAKASGLKDREIGIGVMQWERPGAA